MQRFPLPITAWSAWAPGLDTPDAWHNWCANTAHPLPDGTPPLHFVEPMLKRRLSRLARMAIHVAQEAFGAHPHTSVVYASRHGDLKRTLGMLEAMAGGEMPSPTAFSLSVHNAGMGVFSILNQMHGQSTAISASAESFGYGLLEALARLQDKPGNPVLLVYAEDSLPLEYQTVGGRDEEGFFPHAVALRMESQAPSPIHMTIQTWQQSANKSQSLSFLRALCAAQDWAWGEAA